VGGGSSVRRQWWQLCAWTATATLRLNGQGGAASGRRRLRYNWTAKAARRVDGSGRSVSTPARRLNGVGAAADRDNLRPDLVDKLVM
jgi:hypothetical protein